MGRAWIAFSVRIYIYFFRQRIKSLLSFRVEIEINLTSAVDRSQPIFCVGSPISPRFRVGGRKLLGFNVGY